MVFLIISINFFGFCDAPPIKKPSMSGIIFNWSIFLLLTEPPYKTFGDFFLNLLFIICSLALTIVSRGELTPTSSVLDTVDEKTEDTPSIPENN